MSAPAPFADAAALWHLADAREARGGSRLSIHGIVTLGVELPPDEAHASRRRGGDGRAARFGGGYLEVPAPVARDLTGEQFTLCLRVRDPRGTWQAPLFGSYGDDSRVSLFLEGTDGAAKPFTIRHARGAHHTPYRDLFGTPDGPLAVTGSSAMVELTWGTAPRADLVRRLERGGCGEPLLGEARNGIMKVNFPVARIDPGAWHDLIVRFTGPTLELFIDGVLVDEEFPIGTTRAGTAPLLIGGAATADGTRAGFHGLIDHVALWDRALSDAEITALSGGAEEVTRRSTEILGAAGDRLQYWRPRGHNTRAGDCMPFFHEPARSRRDTEDDEVQRPDAARGSGSSSPGTFHLYYLVVRRNHHGKWQSGHGGLQIRHASSRDLRHWQHHPVAVPISAQWQSWWGTGSFAVHDGTWFTYQKGPSMLPEVPCGGVQLATSSDGIRFTAQPPHPALPGYDCDIFTDPATGTHHLLTTEGPDGDDMAIVRWTSHDLRNWQRVAEPVLVTNRDRFNIDICPHLFEWNGWYYLFAGFDARGGVWMSRQPFGPWRPHRPVRLDLPTVPKTARFPPNRRLYAGFLGDRGWGGNVVFRELIQHAGGSLGTCFPAEMVPATGAPVAPAVRALTANAAGTATAVTLAAAGGAQAAELGGVPRNARLRCTVEPDAGVAGRPGACFGIAVRVAAAAGGGAQPRARAGVLRFRPHAQQVSLGTTHVRPDGALSESVISDVTGLDTPFTVDLVMSHDLVDVCIAGRRTVIGRHWNPAGDRLLLFAEHCSVAFRELEVRPLAAK